MMRMKLNNNKGITLIALVVTITVLLILAGVSISSLTGEKGVIGKAQIAKVEARGASVEEAKDLWIIQDENVRVSLNDLLTNLEKENLLTNNEKTEILNSSPHQITIGSRTIIFE